MDREDLQELYEDGRVTTQFLMQNRRDIREITELVVPRRPGDVEEWWDSHKSVFARRIKPEEEESESTESDNE